MKNNMKPPANNLKSTAHAASRAASAHISAEHSAAFAAPRSAKRTYAGKLAPLLTALVLAGTFYALNTTAAVMNAAATVSDYVRFAVGRVFGLLPFSVYEIGGTLLLLFALLWLIRSVVLSVRNARSSGNSRATLHERQREPQHEPQHEQQHERQRGGAIAKRFAVQLIGRVLPLVTAAAYVWAAFLWLWCSLYFSTPFYSGVLRGEIASTAQLYTALEYFINAADELAPLVRRGENGHIAENAIDLLKRAPNAVPYDKLCDIFPNLRRFGGNAVKPMADSGLMGRMRFTGVYMGLMGEANVNVNTPLAFLPATAAHELGHSHGVGKEDEANFLGIIAAAMSDDPEFSYSGYISGIAELAYALNLADSAAYIELAGTYSDLVRLDLRDNYSYWAMFSTTRASGAVDKAYDRYLKSTGQPLGVKSYGACVNLLAEWVSRRVRGEI